MHTKGDQIVQVSARYPNLDSLTWCRSILPSCGLVDPHRCLGAAWGWSQRIPRGLNKLFIYKCHVSMACHVARGTCARAIWHVPRGTWHVHTWHVRSILTTHMWPGNMCTLPASWMQVKECWAHVELLLGCCEHWQWGVVKAVHMGGTSAWLLRTPFLHKEWGDVSVAS